MSKLIPKKLSPATPDDLPFIRNLALRIRRSFVREGDKSTGACVLVSDAIQERLLDYGHICAIQFGFFDGLPHAWVDLPVAGRASMFLDATADQFGDYPKVILDEYDKYPIRWDERDDDGQERTAETSIR